jgi:hypothetical protein
MRSSMQAFAAGRDGSTLTHDFVVCQGDRSQPGGTYLLLPGGVEEGIGLLPGSRASLFPLFSPFPGISDCAGAERLGQNPVLEKA